MSHSAEASFEIRNYDRSDVDSIVDFYSRAYDGDRARRLQSFRWIQEENPLADSDFSYLLAVRDARVVGYWGRMPARLFVQGTPMPIVYSQEALVDPLCRGQGIGQQLAAKACDIDRCMLSLWHNEKIVSILRKAGWTHVGNFRSWRKTYRWSRVAPTHFSGSGQKTVARLLGGGLDLMNRFGSSSMGSDIDISNHPEFKDEFDTLFRQVREQLPVVADRSAATLQWKYGTMSHRSYHLVTYRTPTLRGYAVLRIVDRPDQIRRGSLVDLLAGPRDSEAATALLNACDCLSREANADILVCEGHLPCFATNFRSAGFRQARARDTSSLWIRNTPHWSSATPWNDFSSWYFTLGDSDGDMW